MLKCKILEINGIKPAIHGMRNPKNSWDRSDSHYEAQGKHYDDIQFIIGDNDLTLMQNLFKAGTEHRKFDRMICVWMDIEAPLYWWKEFDTYKVGTVTNSCSTMHKIHSKEFTLDDFSHEHLDPVAEDVLEISIRYLNHYRGKFNKTKSKDDWWQMIQLLPSSYNQKRTVMMNYEVVARIIQQRTGHKLDEWKQLIDVLGGLPYIKEIMQ